MAGSHSGSRVSGTVARILTIGTSIAFCAGEVEVETAKAARVAAAKRRLLKEIGVLMAS
jgi:hypothetical protein